MCRNVNALNNDDALKTSGDVTYVEPDDAVEFVDKGRILYKSEKYEEALKAYKKAIDIEGKYVKTWKYIGDTLKKLGEYEEARKAYEEAIKVVPGYYKLGKNWQRRKHWRCGDFTQK
jgi:tetratricopeptide (TPR) repeat protein